MSHRFATMARAQRRRVLDGPTSRGYQRGGEITYGTPGRTLPTLSGFWGQ